MPTIWAVTYIFTGSSEQYFAFYIYIVWLIVPIVLNAMILGRISRWHVLVPGFVFASIAIVVASLGWAGDRVDDGQVGWRRHPLRSSDAVSRSSSASSDLRRSRQRATT